jgi:hypothetical protein
MPRISCSRLVVFLAATITSISSAVATPQIDPNDDMRILAIWRVQEFDLDVRTQRGYYTCSSLETKIVSIMVAVGAADVAVKLNCTGLTRNASARIAALVPVPANDDNIRDATTPDARSELVAKLRGAPLPTPDTLQRFVAEWRTVSLGRSQLHIRPEDCDLLREINRQILPQLSVRIVEARLSCDNVSRFPVPPKLVVQALTRTVA